jgi:hypothetical protein
MQGVSRRVEMSLSLTAANEIVSNLSKQPGMNTTILSKMAVLFTVFLVYVDTAWNGTGIDHDARREGVVKILGITRQVSILAVARILLSLVQGPIPDNVSTTRYDDLFPPSSWALVEVLFKSSIVVVCMAVAAKISMTNTLLKEFTPEIERIMYSLQFLFADTITPLIVDYRLKRMICVIGFLFLKYITDNMQGKIDTASKVFYSGLSMGWINILVSMVIPDATAVRLGAAEIVATVTLACMLQSLVKVSPGFSTLQGYVEWHVANTILKILTANAIYSIDIILSSLVIIMGILRFVGRRDDTQDVNISYTVVGICTTIAANTLAKAVVHIVTKQSSFDIFSALFILTITLQAAITFYQQVVK